MLFEPYAEDLVSRVDPSAALHVLEIACGSGIVTQRLVKTLSPFSTLIATDLNPDMLSVARKRVPDQHLEWMAADALDLPFPDSSFDLVVCQFGFMFMPDKARAFAEVCRVLQPGGRLLFNTWDKLANNPVFDLAHSIVANFFPDNPPQFYQVPFSFYDEQLIHELLNAAGFRNSRIHLLQKESLSPSAADAARGVVEGNPILTFIQQRDASMTDLLRDEVEHALSARFGNRPMKAPMQAWVGETRK